MGAIDGKYNVEVDGLGYTLARQPRTKRQIYQRNEAPSFVNKFGSGDPSYRDSSFWSNWVQINWQNGVRQEQFNDEGRFLYDENINIHEEGRFTLAPKLEVHTQLTSAYAVCAMNEAWWGGTDYRLYAGAGDGIYEFNGTNTWDVKYRVGNPPVVALYANDSSMWLGTGLASANNSFGYVYRVSANGTLQSSAVINATNSINFFTQPPTGFTYSLYCGSTAYNAGGGQLFGSQSIVSSWTSLWSSGRSKVLGTTNYLNRMIIAAGFPMGEPTRPTQGIIGAYDNFSVDTLVTLDHTVPTSMTTFDNLLFVGTAHGHLYVYNGSSFDLLFKFWGNDIDMKIESLKVHQDKLYVMVSYDSNLKNSTTKYAGVWAFNRRGLNLDFKQDDSATNYYKTPFTFKNQLYFSTSGSGVSGWTYNVNENLFAISGALQSSYFDANLPSLDKLNKEVVLMYDYLSASTSATIAYKTDETESFTDLGTVKTEGTTSATFQFPSGIAKKKLSYQVTLSTGAVSSTPRIKKVVTKYTVVPDFYHRWQFAIDTSEKIQLLDGTFHPSSGLELESALFDSKRSKQLVIFKDIDYVSTTLNGSLAASATTINVGDASRMPPKGRLRIPSTGEELFFDSRTSTTLNTVTRAYKNTTAASAATAATIDMSYQVFMESTDEQQFNLNQLADDFNHITPVTLLEA